MAQQTAQERKPTLQEWFALGVFVINAIKPLFEKRERKLRFRKGVELAIENLEEVGEKLTTGFEAHQEINADQQARIEALESEIKQIKNALGILAESGEEEVKKTSKKATK